jgi:hypothetical protein
MRLAALRYPRFWAPPRASGPRLVRWLSQSFDQLRPTINTPCKQLKHRTIITCAARALKRKTQRAQTRGKGLPRLPDLCLVCLPCTTFQIDRYTCLSLA